MQLSTKVLPLGNCIVVCMGSIIPIFTRMAMVVKGSHNIRSSIHGTVVLVQRPPQCLSNDSIIPEPVGLAIYEKSSQALRSSIIHSSIYSQNHRTLDQVSNMRFPIYSCRKCLPVLGHSGIITPCKSKTIHQPLKTKPCNGYWRSSVHQS